MLYLSMIFNCNFLVVSVIQMGQRMIRVMLPLFVNPFSANAQMLRSESFDSILHGLTMGRLVNVLYVMMSPFFVINDGSNTVVTESEIERLQGMIHNIESRCT